MKLYLTTDYAIRIILHLAQHDPRLLPAAETAKRLGLTYSYFNKVASSIKQAGFIKSVQGPGGGYRLAQSAKDITLYDIITAVQGDICINRCLGNGGICSQFGSGTVQCSVHRVLETVQNDIVHSLKKYSIQDICKMTELQYVEG
ncbi:Rrf2 family transcriptional regulator [Oscillospiraceae bacterium MB08-C2-2]|nr:Rrf2 family transcriptional regulator [Oscillospiraceae bacterium MB08-C2-2]